MDNKFDDKDLAYFSALTKIKMPNPLEIIPKILVITLVLLVFFLFLIPWQQNSRGYGYIIANDPNNRAQSIDALINGRIKKWFVRDGSRVVKGDKIVEIVDNDPQILDRIRDERDAKKRKFIVAQIAAETAKLNYDRQNELFQKGLSAKKDYENAKIEYKKLLSQMEIAASEVAEVETKLSRQSNQIIYAPKDGTILKVLAGDDATTVKSGDKIATFAPDLSDPAVEIYVNGNDVPLIYEGREVRLQFEGWPAIQFSGWPSIAIGTFAGVVTSVDASVSENGKFRVIVKKPENEKWPNQKFLRHGAKVYGWVLLNNVSIGYEIWRQINGFPPKFDEGTNSEMIIKQRMQ